MKLFGFTSPFDEICFGPITGNLTLLRYKANNSIMSLKNGGGGESPSKLVIQAVRSAIERLCYSICAIEDSTLCYKRSPYCAIKGLHTVL